MGNDHGECDVPALEDGLTYVSSAATSIFVVLLITKASSAHGVVVAATDFAGECLAEVELMNADGPQALRAKLTLAMRGHTAPGSIVRVILPGGKLLKEITDAKELMSLLQL